MNKININLKRSIMKNLTLVTLTTALISVVGCNAHSPTGMESYKHYGEKVEDTKIIEKVKQSFRSNPSIPANLIHLAIDRGIVQLSGFIHNREEADLAILSARSIPGVKDVINSLVVMSSSDYSEKRAKAESQDTRR